MTAATAIPLPQRGSRHGLEEADGQIAIIRLADRLRVGTVALARDGASLAIESVCVDEEHRGHGAGTEAVRLILSAIGGSAERVTAMAPPDIGLAVYFWTRLGFRPRFGPGSGGALRFERPVT